MHEITAAMTRISSSSNVSFARCSSINQSSAPLLNYSLCGRRLAAKSAVGGRDPGDSVELASLVLR